MGNMKEYVSSSSSSSFDFLIQLATLSLPMIANALIQEAQGISTMIFVGRIPNPKYMGAATLGNMMCNITGYSITYGMCSALDTLIAQAYGGKEYELMGLHSQRTIVILSLCVLPLGLLWWHTDSILHVLLAIDTEIAMLAGVWTRYMIIGLWPSLIFQVLRKFLQGCGIVWPVLVANIVSIIVNIVVTYILIYHSHLGFVGAALGTVSAQCAALIVLALIIVGLMVHLRSTRLQSVEFSSLKQDDEDITEEGSPAGIEMVSSVTDIEEATIPLTLVSMATRDQEENLSTSTSSFQLIPTFPLEKSWPALSTKIFTNWGTFFALALPGAFSLFLEWGSYEFMAGFAGRLGKIGLANHGVFMNTAGLFYMVPQSIADSTAILAGQYLGNYQPKEAKSIINLGIMFDFLWGICAASVLLFILRPYWSFIFTSDVEVQQDVYRTLPIMFVYIVVDSTKCIALNTLRSTGRPEITAVGNILSCALLMIPLAWLLTIHYNYGLYGLWGSMSAAWLTATLLYMYVILMTNWEEEAKKASKRNSIEHSLT